MHLEDTARARAAVHEAGHALVAASRGIALESVEIHGDEGAGVTRPAGGPQPDRDRLCVLHGGPQAETVIFGNWLPTAASAEHDDLSLAYKLATTVGVPNLDAMRSVHDFLVTHQAGLLRLASRLMAVGTLEGA